MKLSGLSNPDLLELAKLTCKTELEFELADRLGEAVRELGLVTLDLSEALARLDYRGAHPGWGE